MKNLKLYILWIFTLCFGLCLNLKTHGQTPKNFTYYLSVSEHLNESTFKLYKDVQDGDNISYNIKPTNNDIRSVYIDVSRTNMKITALQLTYYDKNGLLIGDYYRELKRPKKSDVALPGMGTNDPVKMSDAYYVIFSAKLIDNSKITYSISNKISLKPFLKVSK